MVPEQGQRPVYASDGWEIDLARRELRSAGVVVPLGGRAFDIVSVLVQADGELVSKNDLMDQVWPGTIVEENALQVHIAAIRKALGADRGMLKTQFGRGYRLLGSWKLVQDERDAPRPKTPSPEAARRGAGLHDHQHSGRRRQPDRPRWRRAISARSARSLSRRHADRTRRHRQDRAGAGGRAQSRISPATSCWSSSPRCRIRSSCRRRSQACSASSSRAKRPRRNRSPARSGLRKLLLVLDNCEHVIDAAAKLAETIVSRCPGTTVLATSREVLRIDGEYVYRVPPLDVPPEDGTGPADVTAHTAVQLFMARARALGADLASDEGNLAPSPRSAVASTAFRSPSSSPRRVR